MKTKYSMVPAVITVVALTFFCLRAKTQTPQSQDYQAIADKFFVLVEQGKSDDAVDYVFSTNVALQNLPGKLEQLKSQLGEIEKQLGSYHSHTMLAETKVAGTFVYQHYYVLYDRQPISVRLKFYKPRDKWMAYGVQFDTELPDLIQKQTDQNLDRYLK